jgi:hypothetical protein
MWMWLEHVTCMWLLHMDFVPVEGPDTEVYMQTRQQATHSRHTHGHTHTDIEGGHDMPFMRHIACGTST